ncbi:hypothetical protein EON82_03055 [bacterium]|nr:MAG: hypothetical protein EON82_03055 [bacterium]
MALPAIFKLLVETAATDAVLKNLKKIWAKSPWARDPNKVNEVERRIDDLSHEMGRLARNLVPEAVAPEVKRRLDRFERELLELGLPAEAATELRVSVGEALQTTVLEPITEARRLQNRIETLEKENLDAEKRLVALEPLAVRTLEAERRAAAAQTMASIALGAAGIAVVATLLMAILHR